ncbi:Phenylalanyl-tRNA synthetase, beta subunit, cytoplasmic [Cladochytrium tenue]|nr:Phenylalanyl-tRNA synthetase, beta subunit, cytoplasmic [Cladochytrium tenue]
MAISPDDIAELVLEQVDSHGGIPDTADLRDAGGRPLDQLAVLGVLNGLQSRQVVTYSTIELERWVLSKEGRKIAEEGSHEAKVFRAVPPGENGITMTDLQKAVGEAFKFGQGAAFKNKWLKKTDNGIIRLVEEIVDATQNDLIEIQTTGTHSKEKVLTDLKKRTLIEKQ